MQHGWRRNQNSQLSCSITSMTQQGKMSPGCSFSAAVPFLVGLDSSSGLLPTKQSKGRRSAHWPGKDYCLHQTPLKSWLEGKEEACFLAQWRHYSHCTITETNEMQRCLHDLHGSHASWARWGRGRDSILSISTGISVSSSVLYILCGSQIVALAPSASQEADFLPLWLALWLHQVRPVAFP